MVLRNITGMAKHVALPADSVPPEAVNLSTRSAMLKKKSLVRKDEGIGTGNSLFLTMRIEENSRDIVDLSV